MFAAPTPMESKQKPLTFEQHIAGVSELIITLQKILKSLNSDQEAAARSKTEPMPHRTLPKMFDRVKAKFQSKSMRSLQTTPAVDREKKREEDKFQIDHLQVLDSFFHLPLRAEEDFNDYIGLAVFQEIRVECDVAQQVKHILEQDPFIQAVKSFNDACIDEIEREIPLKVFQEYIGVDETSAIYTRKVGDVMRTGVDLAGLMLDASGMGGAVRTNYENVQPCIQAFQRISNFSKNSTDSALLWIDTVWSFRSAIQNLIIYHMKYTAVRNSPASADSKTFLCTHCDAAIVMLSEIVEGVQRINYIKEKYKQRAAAVSITLEKILKNVTDLTAAKYLPTLGVFNEGTLTSQPNDLVRSPPSQSSSSSCDREYQSNHL